MWLVFQQNKGLTMEICNIKVLFVKKMIVYEFVRIIVNS